MTQNSNSYYIPFKKTGYFSKLIIAYLDREDSVKTFYNYFPNLENFKKQIALKSSSKLFSSEQRNVLVTVLKEQYKTVETSSKTQKNISLLLSNNTFTITTGHQLNLFTGPLYFLYKILSAINLCETLKRHFPAQNFVPIYWMATEDHDFEEINYFNFKGKKVQWNSAQKGAVGRFSTTGLESVFKIFSKHLGVSKNATYVKELFAEAYLKHTNLADATRYIANALFGAYGLVVLDADNKMLKRQFAPFVKDELLCNTAFKEVTATNVKLKERGFKNQVNPRKQNLFYLTENNRERIVFKDEKYQIVNTNISFSRAEILAELEKYPERFSPNVIMRPLYEEVILPNLCYIGGGGELEYWLQLKSYFKKMAVPFPILLLRNSALLVSKKQVQKLTKLSVPFEAVFLKQNNLLTKKVKENATVTIDFTAQKTFLKEQFKYLKKVAQQTDASFIGAVKAQEKKQLNGLDKLEKRLLRAEKRKQKELVDDLVKIQNKLFPNQNLEERQRNFSEYYLEYGEAFVRRLKKGLKPLQLDFTILEME